MTAVVLVTLGFILGLTTDFIPIEKKSRLQCRLFGHGQTMLTFIQMKAMPDGSWAPLPGAGAVKICIRCNKPVPPPSN